MLETNHLYMLYCSLIPPYLSYACEIWGNTYKSQLNTLIPLQKTIHCLFNISVQYKYIVKLKTLIVIYKAKNYMLPINLQNKCY